MSAEGGSTITGYIQHHLTNLQVCADSAMVDGHCTGFWTLNLDTLIVSGLLGLITFVIIGVQIALIAFAMIGFRQNWQTEVERRVDDGRGGAMPQAA